MSDITILPVVILYKMKYHQSVIYKKFLSYHEGLRIFVYDNSPESQVINDKNVLYHHNPQNGGVSGGYNYAAQIATMINNVDYLLLLDQDTTFPKNYISLIHTKIIEYPYVNLFVPRIVFGNNQKPFSPVRIERFGNKPVCLEEGFYDLSKYLPVNSGACIKLDCFRKVGGYSPRIFLDFADFDFFSRLSVVSTDFYIMNVTVFQSFSNEETDEEKLKYRFRLYVESGKEAMKNKLIRRRSLYGMVRHSLALSIRTKNLFFVKYLIKNI